MEKKTKKKTNISIASHSISSVFVYLRHLKKDKKKNRKEIVYFKKNDIYH